MNYTYTVTEALFCDRTIEFTSDKKLTRAQVITEADTMDGNVDWGDVDDAIGIRVEENPDGATDVVLHTEEADALTSQGVDVSQMLLTLQTSLSEAVSEEVTHYLENYLSDECELTDELREQAQSVASNALTISIANY